MVCINSRTRAKSSTLPSPCAPALATSHLHHFLRASLGDSGHSTATPLRTAVALVGIWIVVIGAVRIPLKRGGILLFRTRTIQVDRLVTGRAGATNEAAPPALLTHDRP